MIVCDKGLNAVNTVSNRPARVTAVHVVNEHLKMFNRLCGQRKLQTPVNGISELPNLRLCFGSFKNDRVFKQPLVLHLEVLRAFKREFLPLKLTISPDRYLNMFGQGIIKSKAVVAHYDPVPITVVIDLYIKNPVPEIIVNYHIIKL